MGHPAEIAARYFVPRGVLQRLGRSPDLASQGKHVAEVAVLFVDVQGCSVLCEELLLYALLEWGIGVYALFLPFLMGRLPRLSALLEDPYSRFLVTFLLLLPPTVGMGGTLPVLSAVFRQGQIASQVGRLYAWNTFGAVLGTAVAGFVLLPRFGMWRTTLLAVVLNAVAGGIALGINKYLVQPTARSRSQTTGIPPRRAAAAPAAHTARPSAVVASGAWLVLGGFGLSGAVAMLYEVAWTRGLILVLGSSTYAFSLMLVTFLSGLALGSALMTRVVDRLRHPWLALVLCQIGIGLTGLGGLLVLGQLPVLFLAVFARVGTSYTWLLLGKLLLAASLMALPTVLFGMTFPLFLRLSAPQGSHRGWLAGRAYAVNTLGTVLGAVLAGIVVLPALGIQGSLRLAGALNLGLASSLRLAAPWPLRRRLRWSLATVALLVTSLLTLPTWDPLMMTSGVYKEAPTYLRLYNTPREALTRLTAHYRLLLYREGANATVSVVERPSLETGRHLALAIDGKVDASTAGDMPTQVLSGHLPLLLAPSHARVLVIGVASGITVGAVQQYPVEEIVAVEIEPAVIEASRLFNPYNHRYLDDPRLRLILDDARHYLQRPGPTFDVIISEPSNPWMSGPAKLFTREFLELGRSRLQPGGILAQWVQLYGLDLPHLQVLLRTFQAVFPHLLVFQTADADLLLLGATQPLQIDYSRLRHWWQQANLVADLRRVDITSPEHLLLDFRLDAEGVRRFAGTGPLNTDDNGLIEFAAPRSLYAETLPANVAALRQAMQDVGVALVSADVTAAEGAQTLLRLARTAVATHELVLAAAILERAQRLQDSAEAFWLLGEVARRNERPDVAVAQWQQALQKDRRHAPTLLSLTRMLQQRGQYAQAAVPLQMLHAMAPVPALVSYYAGVNAYYLGDYAAAVQALENVVNHTDAAPGWPASPHLPGETLDLLQPDGLTSSQLAHYYRALAYSKLQNRQAATAAHAAFVRELHRWRAHLETHPAQATRLDDLLTRWQQQAQAGTAGPEDMGLASLLQRYGAAPLAPYFQGATLFFLGDHERARHALHQALAQLDQTQEPSLVPYFLGLTEWYLGQHGAAAVQLTGFLNQSCADALHAWRCAQARQILTGLSPRLGESATPGTPWLE